MPSAASGEVYSLCLDYHANKILTGKNPKHSPSCGRFAWVFGLNCAGISQLVAGRRTLAVHIFLDVGYSWILISH